MHQTNSIIVYIIAMATVMAVTFSSSHASSRTPQFVSDMTPSNNAIFTDPSVLSRLFSDINSARLIHTCRRYVAHLKHKFNFDALNTDALDKLAESSWNTDKNEGYKFSQYNGLKNKFSNLMDNYESSTSNVPQFESHLSDIPNDNTFLTVSNDFPMFSSNNDNKANTHFQKSAFEIMEQMCLKYAFDKLLQTQNRDEYLTSKKILEDRNNIAESHELHNLPDGILLKIPNEENVSQFTRYRENMESRHRNPHRVRVAKDEFSSPLSYNNNNNNNNNNDINESMIYKRTPSRQSEEIDDFSTNRYPSSSDRQQEEALPLVAVEQVPVVTSKRGFPAVWTWVRQARAKRRHRLSINNAMITLSNMIWEDQQQRTRNNQNKMKHHMYLQG